MGSGKRMVVHNKHTETFWKVNYSLRIGYNGLDQPMIFAVFMSVLYLHNAKNKDFFVDVSDLP